MKTIICIFGWAQRGKTSSIKSIASLYGIKPDTYDFCDSAMFNGKRIGFASMGDPGSSQKDSIEKLIKEECDTIVCASRTKGQTTSDVMSLARQYGYTLIWTSNYSIDAEVYDLKTSNANSFNNLTGNLNSLFAKSIKALIDSSISI